MWIPPRINIAKGNPNFTSKVSVDPPESTLPKLKPTSLPKSAGITFGNADSRGVHTDFGSEVGFNFGNVDSGGSTLTLEVKLGLPLAMLILGGIHTDFGSEVGITFGNVDWGSALTLEVKLGLPLAMLIWGDLH